jgi:hypothetical protein
VFPNFFETFVTLSVSPVITGVITHFISHIRCISTHKLLYLTPFLWHFSQLVLPHLSSWVFSLICVELLCIINFLCVPLDSLSPSSTLLTPCQFSWLSKKYRVSWTKDTLVPKLTIHTILNVTAFYIRTYRSGRRLCSFEIIVILYSFFWVIPRRPNFICRRFGTLCLLCVHKWCNQEEFCNLFGIIPFVDNTSGIILAVFSCHIHIRPTFKAIYCRSVLAMVLWRLDCLAYCLH